MLSLIKGNKTLAHQIKAVASLSESNPLTSSATATVGSTSDNPSLTEILPMITGVGLRGINNILTNSTHSLILIYIY